MAKNCSSRLHEAEVVIAFHHKFRSQNFWSKTMITRIERYYSSRLQRVKHQTPRKIGNLTKLILKILFRLIIVIIHLSSILCINPREDFTFLAQIYIEKIADMMIGYKFEGKMSYNSIVDLKIVFLLVKFFIPRFIYLVFNNYNHSCNCIVEIGVLCQKQTIHSSLDFSF